MGEKDINIKDSLPIPESVLFYNNPDLIYIFKKTQKIAYACFILSDLFEEREPLRVSLREGAAELLRNSLSLSKNSRQERMAAFEALIASLFEVASYLEGSFFSRLITQMNYTLLKNEIEILVKKIEAKMDKRVILEEGFLHVDTPVFYKGQDNNVLYDKKTEIAKVSAAPKLPKETKSNRTESILALLKKGQELTIKDFSASIKGCSEKTIQRELLSLVAKGVLKKRGERRWSRYSL